MILIFTATNADGPTKRVPNSYKYTYRPVQVDIVGAGSATVAVQGRIDGNSEWVDLFSTTITAIEMVAVTREVRAVVTGVSGTVAVRAGLDVREVV
jgi:hypothetical protein